MIVHGNPRPFFSPIIPASIYRAIAIRTADDPAIASDRAVPPRLTRATPGTVSHSMSARAPYV
ncbi:hypothetical protein, partial [Burkholderia sp.]|uniref:hypothetical protein n=1 Tax=Burkholderia sp. TaxID=36773 RepID=UPI0025825CEA